MRVAISYPPHRQRPWPEGLGLAEPQRPVLQEADLPADRDLCSGCHLAPAEWGCGLCDDANAQLKTYQQWLDDLVAWRTDMVVLESITSVMKFYRRAIDQLKALVSDLNQIGGYGLHWGFFLKKYPQNSRKIKYTLQYFLVLLPLAKKLITNYKYKVSEIIIAPWGLYSVALILALINILNYESFWVGICAITYIVLNHWWYGVRFIKGIYTSKLKTRLL